MSVFICDKTRLPFSIYFLLDFTAHTRSIFKIFTSMNLRNGSFLKQFNKLAVRVLSGIKHSAIASCFNLIKHSCSFIKQYITIYFLNDPQAASFKFSCVFNRAVGHQHLILILFGRKSFLLNQYLITFQRYSGFCNMQMRCLMTSSAQHRPNILPQMRNISSNNCAH